MGSRSAAIGVSIRKAQLANRAEARVESASASGRSASLACAIKLLDALAAIANEDRAPVEAMRKSLALICEHSDWALGRFVLVTDDPAKTLGERAALWHRARPGSFEQLIAESETASPAPRDPFLRAVQDSRRPIWMADVKELPPFGGNAFALHAGLRCSFAFPVIVGGVAEAVIQLFAEAPRAVDATLTALATSIGAQLARLVERHKAQGANAHLGAIVESSDDAIISRSLDGTITSWNSGAERMFGFPAREALGRPITLFMPPARVHEFAYNTRRILKGEIVPPHESQRVTKDGRILDVLVSVSPVRRPSGEIAGASIIVHDISALKEAEQHLQRASRAHRVLAQCSQALVRATDEAELLERMCRILVKSSGYRQAWIGVASDDSGVPVKPVAHAGYGDDAPMISRVDWSRDGGHKGLAREAVALGEIRIARDVLRTATDSRKRARAIQLGYQSAIALPLKSADGLVGVLVLHAAEADAFDDEELLLLTNLADDIAFGISSLRIRIKHREAEAQLRVSERRLRETFEHAAVGIMRVDLGGVVVDANQKVCALLGYCKDELLGKLVRDITHPDDYGAGSRFREQTRKGATHTLAGEKRYLRKDGSVFWARRTMSVASDDTGEPNHFVSIIEDITHSKELERRFELTFDHAPLGMALIGLDGCYLRVNRALVQTLGCETEDLIGKSFANMSHPAEAAEIAEYRRQMLDGSIDTYASESKLVRTDGSSLWTNRTISLVRSPAGEPQYFIRVVQDISERKQALEMIARERGLLRAVVDAVPERIYVKDREGRLLLQNAANLRAHGAKTHEELFGKTAFDLFPTETARRIQAEDASIMASGEPLLDRERATPDASGELRWIASSKVPLSDASGNIVGIVGVNRDITERKRMERELIVSEQTLRATFTHAGVGIGVISLELQYVEVNEQFCRIVGYGREELMAGMRMTAVCVPESLAETEHVCRRLIAGETQSDSREQRLKRKNGSTVWVASAISLVRDADGKAKHFVSVTQDISESKVAEERLLQLAHYDTLTGLPNRSLFNEKVRDALGQTRASDRHTGVMFIDVDRFKTVNDTLGHLEGDKLLKQISERLTRAVRRGDTVGRLGGDEFAVVLTDLASSHDAGIVAQKIIGSFTQPFVLSGADIYVSASIGIALHPDHATDQDTLIKNADAAMYEAKKRGRNGYQFYTPELNARSVELLTFENDLRRALQREEFVLHYQPKSSIATGETTGLEALLRWEHPAQGLVSPRDFIPLLEETGLIVPVGEWVLDRVCLQIAQWQKEGVTVVPVSINISARQFNSARLGENFRRILEKRCTAPSLIELELTESALMVNTQEATRMLEQLKGLGLRLSIDDFGTGYSSLAYLKGFPLDTLKIDRSFVKDIAEDHDDRAITRAIISMAHSLGLSVVAEGVETPAQMQFLLQHGCDQMQGYYLAQPMPAAACAAWLKARGQS